MVDEPAPARHGDDGGRLQRLAEAAQLREGPEGVATVLRMIQRHGPLPLREAARLAKLPLPVATAVRRELEKDGLLARGPRLALSDEGRDFLARELGVRGRFDPTCPRCGGSGLVIGPGFDDALARLQSHVARGPSVDVTLDQAPCTPETALKRALYMHAAGAIEGRAVAFLGDDDSVSVAVALLGRALGLEPFARRLVVIEVDPRRIEHIAGTAAAERLAIECVRHDLRLPLPAELVGRFDAFETDPPYTLDGATLFAARGVEALRPGVGHGAFLSFAELPPDDMLALHRRLLGLGLAVTGIEPGFNRYEGASVLGSTGQMIRLATTAATASSHAGQRFEPPIHTGEVRAKSRRYRCTACGVIVEVGRRHAVATIEALKAQGCPRCGNDRFALLGRTDDVA